VAHCGTITKMCMAPTSMIGRVTISVCDDLFVESAAFGDPDDIGVRISLGICSHLRVDGRAPGSTYE
jgi:hypothetical protein